MRGVLGRIVLGLLLLVPAAAFAAAGYVHDLTGNATVLDNSKGAPKPLKIGDLIDSGNTISTAGNSSAIVKFEDGQVMVLRDNTTFAVNDYAYNKQKVGESRAVFNLLAGGLRFITGVIGSTNKNSYKMTAGVVTIGIRGTDGDVALDPVTQAVTAAVNAGAVVLQHPNGERTIPANSFVIATRTGVPSQPLPTLQAPPGVRAAILRSLAHANVPINTPVVVQASAAAAVALAQARQAENRAEQLKAQAEKATAAATAATATPEFQALAAQAVAAQVAASEAAAQATVAEQRAEQALSTAVAFAQAAFAQAVANGAAPPTPPAPPPDPKTGDVNTLPATGAGTPTDTQQQQLPAAGTTSGTSSTPSGGAGGGSGGGGTASPN
jgi:hypothetical protein